MILKFAVRDLFRHWRFSLFFIFNLTIGLTGFVTLETFKFALQSHLTANAKNILAADIAIESRRELTPDEVQTFQKIPGITNTVVYEFFAMATVADQSKLVKVKATEGGYPLYGFLELQSGSKTHVQDLQGQAQAWIYPEIMDQFNVKVGETIRLGHVDFRIQDVIKKDTTQTFRSVSMAPEIYIPLEQLKNTGLIQFGSTFTKSWLFKLKEGIDPKSIQDIIYKSIVDPTVRVETPDSTSENVGRQLNYLSDYLGLVTLVSLFLSALGAAYLFRLYLQEKLKDIAIFRSLGLSSQRALQVYLLQTFLLSTFSAAVSFIITLSFIPFLNQILQTFFPFEFHLQITYSVFLIGFILAVFGSATVSLPTLLKIREISVSQLFSEEHFQSQVGAPRWFAFLPALFLFIFLAVYESHSFKMGFGFSLGFIIIMVGLTILAWVVLNLMTRLKIKNWRLKYSFLSLQRKKVSALTLFVSLALGSLLINILPQLKVTLQNSMRVDSGSKLPSLFIYDIQDEQMGLLKDYLREHKISSLHFSPLIRARILKVNDQDYERKMESNTYKTREDEREARSRNRGINLTYQEELTNSERIVDGVPFSHQNHSDRAELSVEQHYADRMGFKLGDVLTFDVQGVEVKGQIINFRSVQWTSFQPNFFITMQSGFLEDAPKTFIGALPRMSGHEKQWIQRDLTQKFSNISMIDVDHLILDILNKAEQMSVSLDLMAWLAIVAGYVVLFSIVRTQMKSRRWELNLLKILGAQQKDLIIYIMTEVLVVALLASTFGAAVSLVAVEILCRWIFESHLLIHFVWLESSIIGISILSIVIAWLAARNVMQEKPHHILTDLD